MANTEKTDLDVKIMETARRLWEQQGCPSLSKTQQDAIYAAAFEEARRATTRAPLMTNVGPDGKRRTFSYHGSSTNMHPDWWKTYPSDDEVTTRWIESHDPDALREWLSSAETGTEQLYQDESDETSREVDSIIVSDINEEVKRYLLKHPECLYNLSPRKFEELIASIFEDFGFSVELTQATHDAGRDIIAQIRNSVCRFLTFVECKKYARTNKVGVDIIRTVYGVHHIHGANKSLIVTTSSFTRDAKEEVSRLTYQMELKDYEDIKRWLAEIQEKGDRC